MKQIVLGIATVLHLITHTNTPSAQYVTLLPHVMGAQVSAVQTELKKCTLAQDEIAQLIEVAQNEKKRMQLEIDALGGKKIRWGLLSKGFLQILGTAYCLYNTGIVLWSGVHTARRDLDQGIYTADTLLIPKYLMDLAGQKNPVIDLSIALSNPSIVIYTAAYNNVDPEFKHHTNCVLGTTLTLLGLWATYKMACASGSNLKQGWNYQAVPEKKITQLDEIITYLETHTTQSK